MKTALRSTLPLALVLSATTGCVTLSSDEDVAEAVAESLPPLPDTWAVEGALPGDIQIGWIEALGDPVLTELVREAQANNPDIIAAAANLEASRALVTQARAPLYPQVFAGFNADRTDSPQPLSVDDTVYTLTASASWELDLWGRISAGGNAAYASAQAVEADDAFQVREEHLHLLAGIAGGHIGICFDDVPCHLSGTFMD